MVDIHRLRVFRSVIATGSVQSAANHLGYTPSAVSQHLAALQRETGLALVERVGRGLRPTAAGLALADEADRLLARVSETDAMIADLRDGRSGALTITYFASAGAAWLPTVVSELADQHSSIRLDLRLRDAPPTAPLPDTDLHLAVAGAVTPSWPGFTWHHLVDDPYVAVVPRTHPLARRHSVPIIELAELPWIDNDVARGWCHTRMLDACSAAGFCPTFRVEAHDYPTAMDLVAAGVGITVIPRIGTRRAPDDVSLVPIAAPTPEREVGLVIRDATASTPAAQTAIARFIALADAHRATVREAAAHAATGHEATGRAATRERTSQAA